MVVGCNGFNPYVDLPTIVAFDYDGVILGFDGKLCEEAVRTMKVFSQIGIKIIIWTCRDAKTLSHVEEAFRAMEIDILGININHPQLISGYEVESRKIFAHKYIDDQALGWSKITWEEIRQEVVTYQVQRMLKGEINLKGEPSNMKREIKDSLKVLKDFGIKPTDEEVKEWETWTPIQLNNHVLTLIKRKLGDD